MIKFLLLLSIVLHLSSCAFDYDESSKKSRKRYSKNFDGKFAKAGRNMVKRIKPSESMQAGIPKQTPLNFLPTDYAGYNENYRDYKIRGQKIGKYSNNSLKENTDFKTYGYEQDPDKLIDATEIDDPIDMKENILESGVYSGHFKIGQPYTAFGVSYVPQDYESFEEIGTASWYGSEFHGKKTANGEIYNMGDLTAAHPTLPLPSLIRVTNLQNGKIQILRVNDRGPFAKNRIIDVSEKAAEILGFKNKGTTEVKVELLRDDTDEMLQKLNIKN
jgi:rare lipoprotein A (peptidoglycan hydrolase)